MIWVAWRRLRSVLVASALVVATLITVALVIGRRAQRLAYEWYHAPCKAGGWGPGVNLHCSAVEQQYFSLRNSQGNFILVLVALVLVISSVIGAVTIAAEFDRGTVRWAWTQSRSRQRWWRETTLVALASVIVLLTPLAVTMSWWLGATQYDSRYGTLTFLVGGWVLVPVAVSATVVTMVGGLVLRRPGWLVAVGVLVASAGYYNLHKDLATRLVPEQTVVVTNRVVGGQFTQVGTPSVNSDFLFGGYRRVGRTDTPSAALENQYNVAMNSCSLAEAKRLVKGPNPTSNETPAQEVAVQQICQSRLGIVWINIYIPESEFWTLQDRESAVFLAAGVVLWLGGSQWLRRTRA